jgi:hypothetical protein
MRKILYFLSVWHAAETASVRQGIASPFFQLMSKTPFRTGPLVSLWVRLLLVIYKCINMCDLIISRQGGLVSDIPAGDGKTVNLFYSVLVQCTYMMANNKMIKNIFFSPRHYYKNMDKMRKKLPMGVVSFSAHTP